MKRVFMLLVATLVLTGCGSNNELSEKANTKVTKNEYTREITEEEREYIQLVLNEDYDTLKEKTQSNEGRLKIDYNWLASALETYKDISENGENYSNGELSGRYDTVLRHLKFVKYIPDELKEKIEKVKKISTEKEEYYSDLYEEELEQEKVEGKQIQLKIDTDYRTRNPQPVSIGMTKEEVLTEGWGRPNDINKTTNADGTNEQWVYDGYKYLYFEDGILTTIQE